MIRKCLIHIIVISPLLFAAGISPGLASGSEFPESRSPWFAVPGPIGDGGSDFETDAELAGMSQRAFASALRERARYFALQGTVVPEKAQPGDFAPASADPPSASPQSVSGSADEPFGLAALPTNPAQSCPGFYVIRTHPGDRSEAGRFGAEILLRGTGSRTLQGGINFGGRASAGVRGFTAFNIANARNENQVVNLGVDVGAPGLIQLQRNPSQNGTVYVSREVSAGETSITVTVPPGFYRLSYEPFSASSVRYAVSGLTSYTNRAGGGFQGGAVFGGYHEPDRASIGSRSTGFVGICISEPREVSVEVLARPSYGPSGAAGMEISVSSGGGETFLDSRTPERAPASATVNAIDEIGGWRGLQLASYLEVVTTARQEVQRAWELMPDELDLLLDFTAFEVLSDIRDDARRALLLGAFMFELGLDLGELLVLADGRFFVQIVSDSIAQLPGGAELIDDLLLELTELGLPDIAQAIANGEWLQITGLPDEQDPGQNVPDENAVEQLSLDLAALIQASTEVVYLGQVDSIDLIMFTVSASALAEFLENNLDGSGLGDLVEDEGLDIPTSGDTEILVYLQDGQVFAIDLDLGIVDPALNVGPGEVLQVILIEEFLGSLRAPPAPVQFNVCRLPDDLIQC